MTRWILTATMGLLVLVSAWTQGQRVRVWFLSEEAASAFYEGDLATALELYERIENLRPRIPITHTDPADAIAMALEGGMRWSAPPERVQALARQGVRSYLKAIPCSPPNAWAYAGLASLAASLKAARLRSEEFDLSELSADPLANLQSEDRLQEAALVKAVSLEPNNFYYRDLLGDFYWRHGFPARALAHFQRAVELQPVLHRHYYLSDLASVSPEVLGAVEAGIQAALARGESSRRDQDVHRFMAEIYLRMGRLDDARRSFLAAAALAEEPYVMEIRVGQTYAAEGDLEEAIRWFRKAAAGAPEYPRSWLNLGVTLSRLGRHEEAVDALRRARALEPLEYRPTWLLALEMEKTGRLEDAAALLETLLRLHHERQEAYLKLIEIYRGQGDTSGSVRIARWLAERFPGEPLFQEQVRQLEAEASAAR